MDEILRELVYDYCKERLVYVVEYSPTLNNKLSYNEHSNLLNYVNNEMTYEDGVELIFELGVKEFESKFGRLLKMGLAAVAGGFVASRFGVKKIAGFGLGALTAYMFKKVTDPCWQACHKESSNARSICNYKCYINGCNSIIRDINRQRSKCNDTVNPLKCEKGLDKALNKWQMRREKYLEKLENAKEKYAEKLAKQKVKERAKELKASRGGKL